MSWSDEHDDYEFESSGIDGVSANSYAMSTDREDGHFRRGPGGRLVFESSYRQLPSWEEIYENHGRVPRLDVVRHGKVSPEALRLVAGYMAGEAGYELDELTAAVRPGRPSADRRARLDALGRIVLDLRTLPSGASFYREGPNKKATLEDIGEAFGGLTRDAVLRLERRGARLEIARWRAQAA